MIKSTAEIVIENKATKSMILSSRIKFLEVFMEIFSKKPNKKAEKVVNTALSLNTDP